MFVSLHCKSNRHIIKHKLNTHERMNNKVSENPLKNRVYFDTPLMIVTGIFVTLYLVSNVMAVKIVSIFGLFYFDAGTITFPLAYMLGDVLTEIWGYRVSKKVIYLALLCNIILVICTNIGIWMPSPDYLDETAQAYNHIFAYVPRIVIGSLTGFLLGELSNAYIMERMKAWSRGKHMWLRTIGSSMVGYVFDSVPFVLIAFYGTVSTEDLLKMMLLQYVLKLAIEALAGTPLAYVVVDFLNRYYKRRGA